MQIVVSKPITQRQTREHGTETRVRINVGVEYANVCQVKGQGDFEKRTAPKASAPIWTVWQGHTLIAANLTRQKAIEQATEYVRQFYNL